MCMPRLIIPETYIAQLIPDPTFKPLIMPLRKAHSSSGLDVIEPLPRLILTGQFTLLINVY